MKSFLLSQQVKVVVLLLAFSSMLVTSFSNCSRAKFGILQSDDSNSASDNDALQNKTLCLPSQVALGLDNAGNTICSNLINRNATTCQSDESVFSLNAAIPQVTCYKIADAEQPGATNCPPNFFLSALDEDTKALSCTPVPGHTAPITCPLGQFLQGSNNGTPVCLAGNLQNFDLLCPPGEVIASVVNKVGSCEPLGLSPLNGLTCPAGESLVGNASLTCQDHMTAPANNQTCPSGQMAIAVSDTSISCVSVPTQDFSHFCPQGLFLTSIDNGLVNCSFTPANTFTNANCPVGHFISGFSGGIPTCTPNPQIANGARNACPSGFVPVAIKQGQFVCTPVPSSRPGQCVPLSQNPCVVANGFGVQSCAADGSGFGSCSALFCDSAFKLENGACVPKDPTACIPGSQNICSISNGIGVQTCAINGSGFNSCQPITCNSGFKLESGACVIDQTNSCLPGSQIVCAIANGIGVQTCQPDGLSLGTCTALNCNAGFIEENGQCVVDVSSCTPGQQKACSITNGIGLQTCANDGSDFGECIADSCLPGFEISGNACVPVDCAAGLTLQNGSCVDISGPEISILSKPSNPTSDPDAVVEFDISDPSGVVERTCSFTDFVIPNCTSPFTQNNLPPGDYTLEIRAKDANGFESIEVVNWSVVTCLSGEILSCSVTNGEGQRSCLTNGSGFGDCYAVNCDTGYYPWKDQCIDLTPPELTIHSQPPSSTSSLSATFVFSAIDHESGMSGFGCSLNGSAFTACTSPKTVSVFSGVNQFSIIAFDKLGNTTKKTITWTVTGNHCPPGHFWNNGACHSH